MGVKALQQSLHRPRCLGRGVKKRGANEMAAFKYELGRLWGFAREGKNVQRGFWGWEGAGAVQPPVL